ncbi:sensor histidine kinase [Pistricoccus aurantiacus]|uniref:histidine kinase n=1 Tax=Pistricoccus aurantiacus TaxID=1883414 RepID=A0A5B8SNK3_9GAMM|nr:sensor histidine kinase [Pistricoccus aurantiacus]QEA37637.1 sensor histidine kinase [Pistricoccus aurantiacus]
MSSLRLDPRSLRFRLLVWLGGIALIVVGITWILHGILLNDLARDFLGDRLRQEASFIVKRLNQDSLSNQSWPDSSSPASQVFHHLYALRLGDSINSSHPRWLPHLEPYLQTAKEGLLELHWRDRHLLIYRVAFTLDGQQGVLLIGEDLAQIEAGLATLHRWVAAIAGLVLALLILLNLVAVNRGLRPLAALQRQLEELRNGQRRRLAFELPSELDPLVNQLNRFMDEQDKRLKRSRESVANLSHALKTPLAAVIQALRGSRLIDSQRRAKMLVRLEDMHAQLEAELRRSRIAGPYTGQRTFIKREAEQLIDMFGALYPDKHFSLTTDFATAPPGQDVMVSVERQDFTEILGILLDNAGKWAKHDVHCHLTYNTQLTIRIRDDGAGVAPQHIPQLGQRGLRLDEGRPGHGLGLSILRQLIEQYSGRLCFETAKTGGLEVIVILPT